MKLSGFSCVVFFYKAIQQERLHMNIINYLVKFYILNGRTTNEFVMNMKKRINYPYLAESKK